MPAIVDPSRCPRRAACAPQSASGLPPELRSLTAVADPVGLVAAARVERLPAGAGGAAEADVAAGDVEQDADDPRPGSVPDRRPRVVVAEDEAVALAVQGVAVGAVGAHPDPVAEAVAVDDPGDARQQHA